MTGANHARVPERAAVARFGLPLDQGDLEAATGAVICGAQADDSSPPTMTTRRWLDM